MKHRAQIKAILKDGPMPWERIRGFVQDPQTVASELVQLVAAGDVVRSVDAQYAWREEPDV